MEAEICRDHNSVKRESQVILDSPVDQMRKIQWWSYEKIRDWLIKGIEIYQLFGVGVSLKV